MSWYHQGLRGAKFPRRFCSWCWRSFCWRRFFFFFLWGPGRIAALGIGPSCFDGLLSIEDMGIYSWWWWCWWWWWGWWLLLRYHYYHHSHYGDIRSFKTPVGEKTLGNSGWWDPSALGPSSHSGGRGIFSRSELGVQLGWTKTEYNYGDQLHMGYKRI